MELAIDATETRKPALSDVKPEITKVEPLTTEIAPKRLMTLKIVTSPTKFIPPKAEEPTPKAEAPANRAVTASNDDLNETIDIALDVDDELDQIHLDSNPLADAKLTASKSSSSSSAQQDNSKPGSTGRLRRLRPVEEDRFSQERVAQDLEELLASPDESEYSGFSESDDDDNAAPSALDLILGPGALPRKKKRSPAGSKKRKRSTRDSKTTLASDFDDIYDEDDEEDDEAPKRKRRSSAAKEDDFLDDSAMEEDDIDDILDDEAEDDILSDDFESDKPRSKKSNAKGFVVFGLLTRVSNISHYYHCRKPKKKRKPRSIVPEDFDESAFLIEEDDANAETVADLPGEAMEDVGDLVLSSPKDKVQHIVPADINNRLRQYQRDGVKFLYGLFKEGKGGILGDGALTSGSRLF